MYASTTIANSIIARDPGRTPMAIVKLVYLAHGWSLANKKPIVSDLPEYWQWGPVHEAVYSLLRRFGNDPVQLPQSVPGSYLSLLVPEEDEWTCTFLDELVRIHKDFTAVQLSNYCHSTGTPWAEARARRGFARLLHTPIPESEMLRYFGTRLEKCHREIREAA